MILSLILFLILPILLKVHGEETEINCTKDYCKKFLEENKCPELSEECRAMNATHSGVWLRFPDVCNCCNYCLTNVAAGGNCAQGLLDMSRPTEICGPGLECTMNNNGTATCQKLQTNCTKAQEDWDKRRADGTLGVLEVRPKCDQDGLFSSSHCIPGSICYCTAPDGQRIFGELAFLDPWDEQKMTCGCSLLDWKARGTLDPTSVENKNVPVLSARCNEYGQFDPLQCLAGVSGNCTCVDPTTGHPTDPTKLITIPNIKKNNPPCFDDSRHKIGIYRTECETMRSSYLNDETTLYEDPICQPDGMFHRLQLSGDKKICVDPSGRQIVHQGVAFESTLADTINCNCARTLWLLKKSGISEVPKCDSLGNYQPWQCRRSKCYCVDANGDQCGSEESSLQNADKLTCYTKQSSKYFFLHDK